MEMHPKTNDLIIATHGRGIIILDDVSPLQALNSEITTKTLHFFDSKPFTMSEKSSFGGTSSEVQFVGDNPKTDAQIKYVLPKRHTFGKMSMEILDLAGNLITTLQAGKQKGINTVEWGFNRQAPKVAKGKTIAGAAMFAPRVKAGKYKVRITKGTDVFEKEIEVQYDPKSPFTLDERTAQQKVTQELFDFTQKLAYLVYQIDSWDATIDQFNAKNSAPHKSVQTLNKELDELRDKLVVTKGDNYVGAGEPKLREKLGDIYSSVGSYFGAPSVTQLDNIQMLTLQFEEATKQFDKIKSGSLKAFEKELSKNTTVQAPKISSFEEFIKSDK